MNLIKKSWTVSKAHVVVIRMKSNHFLKQNSASCIYWMKNTSHRNKIWNQFFNWRKAKREHFIHLCLWFICLILAMKTLLVCFLKMNELSILLTVVTCTESSFFIKFSFSEKATKINMRNLRTFLWPSQKSWTLSYLAFNKISSWRNITFLKEINKGNWNSTWVIKVSTVCYRIT